MMNCLSSSPKDTISLRHTVSILILFLLLISGGMVAYTETQDSWMREKVVIKTFPIEKLLNETLPKKADTDIPGQKEDACDILRFINKSLAGYPNGRITFDVNIGLKDMCMFIQILDFGAFDSILPQFYTCKKHDFLDHVDKNMKKMIRNKWSHEKVTRKLFDKAVHVIHEVSQLILVGLSITVASIVCTFLKTPFIRNFLKSRKIFMGLSFVLVVAAAVSYTWAIILFYQKFDPQTILKNEKVRLMRKKNLRKEIWSEARVSQRYGKSFFMLIGSDAILILVLVLSIVEYEWTRIVNKDSKKVVYHRVNSDCDDDKDVPMIEG